MLFLEEQLNSYFAALHAGDDNIFDKPAKVENMAGLDDDKIKSSDNIYITLVNISEEATLKNTPYYQKENMTTVYRNPPVHLNLFILFSAVMKKYDVALLHLSAVIRFFQSKNVFTPKNSTSSVINELDEFEIVMDLFSLSFEQVNYLWSTLGGKQHPFALYKLRLVIMQREGTTETRGIIKEITLNENTLLKQ